MAENISDKELNLEEFETVAGGWDQIPANRVHFGVRPDNLRQFMANCPKCGVLITTNVNATTPTLKPGRTQVFRCPKCRYMFEWTNNTDAPVWII